RCRLPACARRRSHLARSVLRCESAERACRVEGDSGARTDRYRSAAARYLTLECGAEKADAARASPALGTRVAVKGGIYIAIALLLGAILASILASDPGYVAIRAAGHLIEMSAVTFVLLLIAGYFVVRLLLRVLKARSLWKTSQLERRRERARRALERAILELARGEWENAESTATRFIGDAEYPMAHYLVAARAAELQASTTRRDEWLARALDLPAESHAPALIMQAELLLKHNQAQAAQAALEQLDSRGEQNARGLLLLA